MNETAFLVAAAVQGSRTFTCRICPTILDVTRTVHLVVPDGSATVCASCFDALRPGLPGDTEVHDGRTVPVAEWRLYTGGA